MATTGQAAQAAEQVARSYFEALSARDTEAAAGHWHPDGIEDVVPVRVLRGVEEIRGFIGELVGAMPDLTMAPVRITADERMAVVEYRLSGTFTGARFQGIEPTGSRIELRGCDCLEVADGRIVRNTAYYDATEVARAVGMLPPKDSSMERAMTSAFNGATKLRAVVREQLERR